MKLIRISILRLLLHNFFIQFIVQEEIIVVTGVIRIIGALSIKVSYFSVKARPSSSSIMLAGKHLGARGLGRN